jgi:hypothetical protein
MQMASAESMRSRDCVGASGSEGVLCRRNFVVRRDAIRRDGLLGTF